jgi:putative membrane protein
MMWHDGWGGWVGGLLMMALFWAGLTAAIYLVVRAIGGSTRTPSEPSDAIGVLEDRFARGEISTEEFEERRSVIQEHAA